MTLHDIGSTVLHTDLTPAIEAASSLAEIALMWLLVMVLAVIVLHLWQYLRKWWGK